MGQIDFLKKIEKSHLEIIKESLTSYEGIKSLRKEEGQSNTVYLINETIVFRFNKEGRCV